MLFQKRHIGPTSEDIKIMLRALGVRSVDELMDQTIPKAIFLKRELDLPEAATEQEALAEMRALADQNQRSLNFIGQGYYGTYMPPAIQRNFFENPGFYTAYTPYQAEISQGRLECLVNFQQMVMDLTGFELANASLLDEATAAGEAMMMAQRVSKSKSKKFLLVGDLFQQSLSVLNTRAQGLGLELVRVPADRPVPNMDAFGAIVQYPDAKGLIGQPRERIAEIRSAAPQTVIAVGCDLLALALLVGPGHLGADMAFGSSQRFGVPMGFGGPHAAFFACREGMKRLAPGRIIGLSKDWRGQPAYRMALQTREQHIRRDKATSNICTAQALLANISGLYAVYHGPEGIRAIAEGVQARAGRLAAALEALGFNVESDFFDCLRFDRKGQNDPRALASSLEAAGIDVFCDGEALQVAIDETHDDQALHQLVDALAKALGQKAPTIPDQGLVPKHRDLARTVDYLSHPVFHRFRSETAFMRYLRQLQEKDLGLDRSMIPLGSCTMKLNAAAEMIPCSWPEFAELHPYAPASRSLGYQQIFRDLEVWLGEITGLPAVSLQPNAGSQGEFAGLLAIRRYLDSLGQGQRDLCLIPASAHGTNPASAVLAGLEIRLVKTTGLGTIDFDHLRSVIGAEGNRVAAVMVTYPSTYGVFDRDICELCQIVHDAGGQVYLDGANMNAMVGLARPGDIGADVCHLNLHKTFCIPHGGGGPGMGPIAAQPHLEPFLPGDPRGDLGSASIEPSQEGNFAVSAARYGSPLILPISWMYIRMMGPDGLKEASRIAIVAANYLASRLEASIPVAFTNEKGRVAHECIFDMREIKARVGISSEDIAKRLMDYGFHGPTMSWPLSESLMVEPTESEPLEELDRFIEAMSMIAEEIAEVERGGWTLEENPLVRAPHTLADCIADWSRPYRRERGMFPTVSTRRQKYWPAVGRIDNVAGDRNLVCSCPPLEAYLTNVINARTSS